MNLENIGNDINVNNTASTSINTEKDDEKSKLSELIKEGGQQIKNVVVSFF